MAARACLFFLLVPGFFNGCQFPATTGEEGFTEYSNLPPPFPRAALYHSLSQEVELFWESQIPPLHPIALFRSTDSTPSALPLLTNISGADTVYRDLLDFRELFNLRGRTLYYHIRLQASASEMGAAKAFPPVTLPGHLSFGSLEGFWSNGSERGLVLSLTLQSNGTFERVSLVDAGQTATVTDLGSYVWDSLSIRFIPLSCSPEDSPAQCLQSEEKEYLLLGNRLALRGANDSLEIFTQTGSPQAGSGAWKLEVPELNLVLDLSLAESGAFTLTQTQFFSGEILIYQESGMYIMDGVHVRLFPQECTAAGNLTPCENPLVLEYILSNGSLIGRTPNQEKWIFSKSN